MKKFVKSVAAICAAAILMGSVPIVSLGAGTDAKSVSIAPKEGIKAVKVTTEEATPFDGVVIYAVYEGQSLSSVEAKEFKNISSAQDGEVQFDKAYTKSNSKLFVWNSLSEMVPYNVTVVPEKVQISTAAKIEISGDTTAPATLTATISAINDSGFEDTNAFTYEWKKGEETLSETGATLTNAVEGNYTVTATYNGSGNYEGSVTTAAPYVVSPAGDTREDIAGKVTVSVISDKQTAGATLTASISAGETDLSGDDFTYVWSKNGSPISGGENGTLENVQAGEYTVIATVKSENTDYKGSTAASQAVTIKAVYTVTWSVDGETTQESYADGETPSYSGTPSKAQTDTDTFEFTDWNPAISAVTGDITYTAQFSSSKRSYNVTYNKNEGTIENEANYTSYTCGKALTLPTPTRNGYTFGGWYEENDFSGAAVTTIGTDAYGDKEYFAKWEQNAPDTFTITWKNDDGTTIKTTQAASGSVPVFDGTTPTKAETAQYTYTFAGWTPTVAEATANAEYTATFTPSLRSYTITWQNDDETEIDHETLEYGATPSHAEPSKTNPNNNGYTYTFTGWSPAIVDVVGDQIYKATFGSEAKQFDVIYTTKHGTAPMNVKYTYGVGIAELPALTDDNYNLVGWYSNEERTQAVTSIGTSDFGNKTLYAKWQAKTPDIQIDFENEQLTGFAADSSYTIDGNDVEPAEGKLAADNYIGQTISIVKKATSPDIDSAAQSLTVDARPDAPTGLDAQEESAENAGDGKITGVTTAMEYKLSTGDTWKAVEGTEIENLAGGTYYVRIKATSSAFASENATVTVATHGLETVIFKNEDGTVLDTQHLAIGATPVYSGTPTKAATAEYTYTFKEWTPEITVVAAGGAEYTATYTATKNKYTITWVDYDDKAIRTDSEQEYGTAISAPTEPTRAATDEYTYTFTGWTPIVAETVTGNATYKATYSETKNKYTITWNIDGTATNEQLDYGAAPSHEAPSKTATAQYTYTFKGWSTTGADDIANATTDLPKVTASATYYAVFEQTANKYTVTWKSQDGSKNIEVDTEVEYGTKPSFDGAEPAKDATNEKTYTFAGWATEANQTTGTAANALDTVSGDITYYAAFSEAVRTYTIIWKDGDNTLKTDQLTYGAMPSYSGAELTKTGYSYTWTPEIANVTGDATYTANWTINKYTVTNNSSTDDGTKHGTISLATLDADGKAEYNSTITVTPTAADGYELKKITVNSEDITAADSETGNWQFTVHAEDVTVTATFGKKAVKSVTVTGAARVQKGKTVNYTAKVTAEDDTDITSVYASDITWSVDETSKTAETSIADNGTLTVNIAQTADITVTASVGEISGTATVTPTTQRPDALEITSAVASHTENGSNIVANTIDGSTSTYGSILINSGRLQNYMTYDLGETKKSVTAVEIYFYKGNERVYDFDIKVSNDGIYWENVGSFKSSGSTAGFERFEVEIRNAKYVRYVGRGSNAVNNNISYNEICEFEVYGNNEPLAGAEKLTITSANADVSNNDAAYAIDNNIDTRWSALVSNITAGNAITFNLGEKKCISAVDALLYLPDQRTYKFDIRVSSDGSNYKTIKSVDATEFTINSTGEGLHIEFDEVNAQYVQYLGYGATSKNGDSAPYNSIYEFGIYGTDNLLPEPTQQTLTLVGASAEQSNNDGYARYAIDGKEDTRWAAMVDYSSDKTKENTITFDLAETKCISAAEIYFFASDSRNYQFDIWVSNDGTMWQKAGTYTSSKKSKYERFEFEAINARYVQYAGRALGIDKSYNGFWEFRVYGFDEADEKVPDAPTTSTTNLKATYAEDSKTVTWDAFDGASYYTVEYQKYGVTQAVSDKLTDCTYTDSDGGDYGYVVKGYKVTGELIAQSEMVGAENSAYYYVTADMNTVTTFNRVDIDWNGDAPSDYLVASSSDGVTWTKMDNNSTESNTVISFSFEKPFYVYKDYNARYVRVISDTDISAAVISISKKTDVAPAGSSMLFQKADGTDIKSSNTVNVDIRLNVKNEWPSACLYWDVAEAKTYDFDEANIIIPLSSASDISRVEIGAYYAYPGDGQEFKRTSFAKNYKISYINSAEGTVNANSDGWQELESGDATGKGRLIANFDSVKATHVKFTMSGGEVKGANDNKIATFLSYIGVYTSDDIDSTSTSGSYTAGNE